MPPSAPSIPWFERDELDYQEFSANGVRTFAITEGRAECRPIVFVHGLPGASFVWRPLLLSLTRTQRSIAYDLPGWGRSRSAFFTTEKFSPASYATWLTDALNAQGVTECDMVAHGIGASIVMEFLLSNPTQVGQVVWIQPHFLQSRPSESIGARIASRFISQRWTEAEVESFGAGRADNEPSGSDYWKAHFRVLLLHDPTVLQKRDVSRLETECHVRAGLYREKLLAMSRNSVVIWGAQAGTPHENLPSAMTKRLDCGALPMLERPGDVQEIIRDFLLD